MQKINSIKSMSYKIILIFCIIFLSNCGFHLRSQSSLPKALHKIYLQTDNPYDQFETAFAKSLSAIGVTILDKPDSNCPTLALAPTTFTSDNSSIGGSVQARVYNLTFTTNFKINNGQGKTILDAQTITVTKGLTLNPNEIFSASNQVDIEKQSMQQEAIVRILNILSSKQMFAEIASH